MGLSDHRAYSQLYVQHLLPFFASLDPSRHPWWWPKDGGRALEDWGLAHPASQIRVGYAVTSIVIPANGSDYFNPRI